MRNNNAREGSGTVAVMVFSQAEQIEAERRY